MDNFDYPAIGQRIKQLRKRKGLNQSELAQMLKKSLRTVQKYETGEIFSAFVPARSGSALCVFGAA